MTLRDFLRSEAAGGVLLMLAAALAMLIANGPLADIYFGGLQFRLGPLSLLHWINDGLMAAFFLLVGLEIRREFAGGRLSRWSDRALPMIAAASGMAVPALVYLAVAGATPRLARGWAIPAATDIAFAVGVMALLGKRVPASLKLFLVTVAVVDDMGAVAIIALAYSDTLNGPALLAALAIMAAMFALNRAHVARLAPYLLLAALLWLAVLLSGVHATIAGVLSAMFIPLRRSPRMAKDAEPPLHRLEHALQPWVAYAIVPVFGFANAGVSFAGIGLEHLLSPLPLGIAAGLFLGKQAGVLGALRLCAALRLAPMPAHASWTQIYGVCLLCGIGFTMSLFIGGLAFDDPLLLDEVKIGVLGGSILSATAGYLVLRLARQAR
ncbi:MAG: Na+/H+ antiporter NhaA [Novosphingobium sp.]